MPSYSPVYSAQLLLGQHSTGFPSFEVPAGYTVVVRDFSVWDTAAGAVIQLLVQDSADAPALTVAALEVAGVAQYAQWQGRVVVPALGILSLGITDLGDDPEVYVGGYLLQNTLT